MSCRVDELQILCRRHAFKTEVCLMRLYLFNKRTSLSCMFCVTIYKKVNNAVQLQTCISLFKYFTFERTSVKCHLLTKHPFDYTAIRLVCVLFFFLTQNSFYANLSNSLYIHCENYKFIQKIVVNTQTDHFNLILNNTLSNRVQYRIELFATF